MLGDRRLKVSLSRQQQPPQRQGRWQEQRQDQRQEQRQKQRQEPPQERRQEQRQPWRPQQWEGPESNREPHQPRGLQRDTQPQFRRNPSARDPPRIEHRQRRSPERRSPERRADTDMRRRRSRSRSRSRDRGRREDVDRRGGGRPREHERRHSDSSRRSISPRERDRSNRSSGRDTRSTSARSSPEENRPAQRSESTSDIEDPTNPSRHATDATAEMLQKASSDSKPELKADTPAAALMSQSAECVSLLTRHLSEEIDIQNDTLRRFGRVSSVELLVVERTQKPSRKNTSNPSLLDSREPSSSDSMTLCLYRCILDV